MSGAKRAGFTVLEVAVASTVLVVALGLALSINQQAARHGGTVGSLSQLRAQVRLTLARVEREIATTSLGRLTSAGQPIGAGTTEVRQVEYPLCTGWDGTNATYEDPPRELRFVQGERAVFQKLPTGLEIPICSHVEDFAVSVSAGVVTLRLKLSVRDPADGSRIQVEEKAHVRPFNN